LSVGYGRSVVFFGTTVSSTNKIDRHDIFEILLKVVLNTITQHIPPLTILQNTRVSVHNIGLAFSDFLSLWICVFGSFQKQWFLLLWLVILLAISLLITLLKISTFYVLQPNEAGLVYVNRWHTHETHQFTSTVRLRGYKGEYDIIVHKGGSSGTVIHTRNMTLDAGGQSVTIHVTGQGMED